MLLKLAERKRRRPHSIMWYHNRRKQLGLPPKRMSTLEYMRYKKAFKKAKREYSYVKGY